MILLSPLQVYQAEVVSASGAHIGSLFQLLGEEHNVECSLQAQVNERLRKAGSWEELNALLGANWGVLDFVNVSTAWTRLATLYGGHGEETARQPGDAVPNAHNAAFRHFVAQLIELTAQHLEYFGVQALSNVMWAMSNADWHLDQHEPALGDLVTSWCRAVRHRVAELRAPDVSNISTAIGRLDDRWRPDFVVEFYRAVLHDDALLNSLDIRTLNNLLYGLSRAHRKGLTSLLVNCHKLGVRLSTPAYAALMKLQMLPRQGGPLDRWTFSYVTALVDAHRRVRPSLRPNLCPLYGYVEGRLGEATTSQLAMLAHAFAEMGYPPRPAFWGTVFAAKSGILPPRGFLRLYVERVPSWLRRRASDVELAQAVETLQLLRWVPRQELGEALGEALERRAPASKLPLRRMPLFWVSPCAFSYLM
eukprot:XP_001689613.1 predicted protein [Chlamydomonas reinhardtii]